MRKKTGLAGAKPDASVRQRAYSHIQRKIASGELAAGSAISELAFAKELGSSRTPVREAISQLVAEGLLDQTPNRGAVVMQLTRQDIVDLFELREALEVYAISKAARQVPRQSDIERLRKLADEASVLKHELQRSSQKALNQDQMRRHMMSDLGFHSLLMRMAANARIMKIVNETRLLIRVFAMRHRGHDGPEMDRIREQHLALLAAVEAQNPQLAARLLSEHVQSSLRERLEEYDYMERERSLEESVPAFFNILAFSD